MQGDVVNVPIPELVKLTVPLGVIAVPGELSVTVAVQVEAWLMATLPGVQASVKVTLRLVTVTAAVLGPLPEWAESPPYVPLIV